MHPYIFCVICGPLLPSVKATEGSGLQQVRDNYLKRSKEQNLLQFTHFWGKTVTSLGAFVSCAINRCIRLLLLTSMCTRIFCVSALFCSDSLDFSTDIFHSAVHVVRAQLSWVVNCDFRSCIGRVSYINFMFKSAICTGRNFIQSCVRTPFDLCCTAISFARAWNAGWHV